MLKQLIVLLACGVFLLHCQNSDQPNPPLKRKLQKKLAAQELASWQDSVGKYKILLLKNAADSSLEAKYCHALGGLPWYQILAGEPKAAIAASNTALARCPEKTWIVTNLALAYVFDGQWAAAEAVYSRWKDKPWAESGSENPEAFQTFGDAFLADLDYLAKLGVSRPDFVRVQDLLLE
jgi:hypothetical protein